MHASCFEKASLPAGARCAGGAKKLAVMPDGSAYPCNLLAHFPEFRLGNILRADLSTILSHPALEILRKCAGNTCGDMSCVNCTACTGGCPAHNLMHRGDINGQDIRCSR